MRIVFICGCLEPGKDGVGDYTRRLAAGLIIQNVEIAILAINDQFITENVSQDQTFNNINVSTCRIPSNWNAEQRYNLAKKWIGKFNPDWISLQYVSFSFDTKGLPFNLNKNMTRLTQGKLWHIMFHELWVGMEKRSTLKHIIWGEIQKFLIIHLIKKLNPKLIHTQTKLYQLQLKKLGVKTNYLPLFSNIPINKNNIKSKSSNDESKITLINFGTIHPTVPIESFASEAALYEKKTGIKIELILIGRCGNEQKKWVDVWQSFKLNISVLGEQSSEVISNLFTTSTFGITTTALPLLEKSGSVAAMFEHKLPVICISNPWYPRGKFNIHNTLGIIEYNFGNFESIITMTNNKNISYLDADQISKQFKDDLKFAAM